MLDRCLLLRTLQTLNVVLSLACLRRFQLGVSSLAFISSCVEAIIAVKISDPWSTSDPDVVYALFLALVWSILLLGLTETGGSISNSHSGAWITLLVFGSVVAALQADQTSSSNSLFLARSIVQAIQLGLTSVLLGATVLVKCVGVGKSTEKDDEHRPLLGGEDGSPKSDEQTPAKEVDQEEIDRQQIRERAGWQYLASFKVFLPFMFPRSRQQRVFFSGMLVISGLKRVVTVALPLSLGAVVDGLGTHIPWAAIALYGFLRFLVSPAGLSLIDSWLSYQLNTDMTMALNRHCYDHLMNLSADFHDSKKSSLIWQTMSQGSDVVDLFHDCLFDFVPTLIDFAAAAVVLTYLFGAYMLFIVTVTSIFFYWLTLKALHKKRALNRSIRDTWMDQWHHLTETTMNWSTVTQFGRISHEMQHYREKGDIYRSTTMTFWLYECWTRWVRYTIPSISFLAACGVAALQIGHGQHKIGDFVVLVTYWAQVTSPLDVLANNLWKVARNLVNAERLLVLLEKTPAISDPPVPKTFTFLGGAIEFENVSFSYDGKRKVADNLSFRGTPGQTIALVGQTGSGKSTILKLLFRFYDPEQGRILIDGQDVRQMAMEGFRKHIAIIPQTPVVFNASILENVKYPDVDCTDEEVTEACKAAALHDKIMTFTFGYQEQIGERGTKLSGGELQRLAIARAMLKRADILLLDEATSSVDSITEKHIQTSLRKLCAGKTTLVIAHRLSTILHADQILVIRDGQVVESGTHKVLIGQKGAYNELWSSQVQTQPKEVTKELDGDCLINDVSSNKADTGNLAASTTEDPDAGEYVATRRASGRGLSSILARIPSDSQASRTSSKERAKANGQRITLAPGRRLSRSKSPTRPVSDDPEVRPKSPLKPTAPEFVPRSLQNSLDIKTQPADTGVEKSTQAHQSEDVQRPAGRTFDGVYEEQDTKERGYNLEDPHRRTASEPFLPNDGREDSDETSERDDDPPLARTSRLPEMSTRRTVSASERRANESFEEDLPKDGPQPPPNTGAASPNVFVLRGKETNTK
ncbi:hypothetical protein EDD36DRAFT_415972 [Exophiala viscosa]|uniref:ABC transporter n=1 Tax=Exophiala viscosa TaxID=2486360 RepID=A0AAN6IHB9_9EURO|nr:hypothetical protein EDD36DRAFT_415972 [Exophiala viscosa]